MDLRSTAQPLAGLVVSAVLLLACGESEPTGVEVPETDSPDAQHELTGSDVPASAEEVYAEIAAMDLSYEERLDYLYEKAVEEGAVLQYGSSNLELQEAWSEGFQEDYPEINHLYVRQRLDDLYERILAEARSDRHLVDVIETTAVSAAALRQGDLIADHHGVIVPEGYPDQFIEGWAVVSLLTPQVIVWNTDAISEEEAPRDWDDFLEPEHSGCVLDAGSQSFLAGMIADRGYEATEAWVQGFLDNGGVVRRGLSGTARALAAGEVDCAVYLNVASIEELITDDGAPLAWHAADPTFGSASGVQIYKHTERPHAAALLAHWILGRGGAEVVTDDGRVSVHPDIQLRYERLQPFVTAGSDLEQRLRPVLAGAALEVDEQVFHVIETYLMPNLVQD